MPEMTTPDMVDLFIKIATFAIAIGSAVYAFFATRRKDVDERLEAQGKRLEDLAGRVRDVEKDLAEAPARSEMHEVSLQMEQLRGDFRSFTAEARAQMRDTARLGESVTRIEEHLLKGVR